MSDDTITLHYEGEATNPNHDDTSLFDEHIIGPSTSKDNKAMYWRLVHLKNNFSSNSIAQKSNEIFDKILPCEARAEFWIQDTKLHIEKYFSFILFEYWLISFQKTSLLLGAIQ